MFRLFLALFTLIPLLSNATMFQNYMIYNGLSNHMSNIVTAMPDDQPQPEYLYEIDNGFIEGPQGFLYRYTLPEYITEHIRTNGILSVVLFENDVLLDQVNCAHWNIEHIGLGQTSFVEAGYLYFSTSDNQPLDGKKFVIGLSASTEQFDEKEILLHNEISNSDILKKLYVPQKPQNRFEIDLSKVSAFGVHGYVYQLPVLIHDHIQQNGIFSAALVENNTILNNVNSWHGNVQNGLGAVNFCDNGNIYFSTSDNSLLDGKNFHIVLDKPISANTKQGPEKNIETDPLFPITVYLADQISQKLFESKNYFLSRNKNNLFKIPLKEVSQFGTHGYAYKLPQHIANLVKNYGSLSAILLENDTIINRTNCWHSTIQNEGLGATSFCENGILYFSTSNNSTLIGKNYYILLDRPISEDAEEIDFSFSLNDKKDYPLRFNIRELNAGKREIARIAKFKEENNQGHEKGIEERRQHLSDEEDEDSDDSEDDDDFWGPKNEQPKKTIIRQNLNARNIVDEAEQVIIIEQPRIVPLPKEPAKKAIHGKLAAFKVKSESEKLLDVLKQLIPDIDDTDLLLAEAERIRRENPGFKSLFANKVKAALTKYKQEIAKEEKAQLEAQKAQDEREAREEDKRRFAQMRAEREETERLRRAEEARIAKEQKDLQDKLNAHNKFKTKVANGYGAVKVDGPLDLANGAANVFANAAKRLKKVEAQHKAPIPVVVAPDPEAPAPVVYNAPKIEKEVGGLGAFAGFADKLQNLQPQKDDDSDSDDEDDDADWD